MDEASAFGLTCAARRALDEDADTLNFMHGLVEELIQENAALRSDNAVLRNAMSSRCLPDAPVQMDHSTRQRIQFTEAAAVAAGTETARIWAQFKRSSDLLRAAERRCMELELTVQELQQVGSLQTSAVRELSTHCDAKNATIRNILEGRESAFVVTASLEGIVAELRNTIAVEREQKFLLQAEVDRLQHSEFERISMSKQLATVESELEKVRMERDELRTSLDRKRIQLIQLELQQDKQYVS